jgi:hypothetical protein
MADNKTKLPEDGSSVAAAEAALDRLAARLAEQSIGAQIRRLLPKIEKAIESGATHEEIVATLGESGISMSLATFRSALYRARKRAARDQGGSRKGSSKAKGGAGAESGTGAAVEPGGGQASKDAGDPDPVSGASGKQSARDPLAVPPRPRSFEWDPTKRPVVTFVSKDDGEPESSS